MILLLRNITLLVAVTPCSGSDSAFYMILDQVYLFYATSHVFGHFYTWDSILPFMTILQDLKNAAIQPVQADFEVGTPFFYTCERLVVFFYTSVVSRLFFFTVF